MIGYLKGNSIYLDLVSPDIEDALVREFSVFNPKAVFTTAYEMNQWDGRIVRYSRKEKKLALPFLNRLKKFCKIQGYPLDIEDKRGDSKYPLLPKEDVNKNLLPGIELEDYQVDAILSTYDNDVGIHAHSTGAGKCLGKGTKILMYNGSIKNVEDIVVGDLLMGDDSKPRKVLSICNGKETLYRVEQKNGIDYVVNESHILSLKYTNFKLNGKFDKRSKTCIDISVKDYLNLSKTKKHVLKGYKVPVDFDKHDVPFDPYFLGLWLGDGIASDLQICVGDADDNELHKYLDDFASSINLKCIEYPHYGKGCRNYAIRLYKGINNDLNGYCNNPLRDKFRNLNLFNNKHVPNIFKFNNDDVRLSVLAGFIDSDGEANIKKGYCSIIHRDGQLIDDICFIARSLGFRVSKSSVKKKCTSTNFEGIYTRLNISGNLDRIPTKLDRKKFNKRKINKDSLIYGITLENIGYGEYYGFEIDGNKRFLLEDFTVTHNTEMLAGIVASRPGCPTVIIAEEKIVLKQIVQRLQLRKVAEEPGKFFAGKRPNGQTVIVGSIQSLRSPSKKERNLEMKRRGNDKAWQTRSKNARFLQEALKLCEMVLVDECDRCTSDSYERLFNDYLPNARWRYGFSGTPFDPGRPVQNLILEERLGDIISHSTRKDVQDKGRIIPVEYYMFTLNEDGDKYDRTDNNTAIKESMISNERLHNIINNICNHYKDEGTLILVDNIEMGNQLLSKIEGSEFIHGKTSDTKRNEVLKRFENRELNILIGSKILRRGLDLDGGCENLILCYDGQMQSEFLQRIGRAVRRNKKGYARIFDFMVMSNYYLYKHAKERLKSIVNTDYPATIIYKGNIRIKAEDLIKRRWRFPK